jgi:hypothetical protein
MICVSKGAVGGFSAMHGLAAASAAQTTSAAETRGMWFVFMMRR